MSPDTTSQVPSATGRHTPLKTYCHPESRPQKAIEWLRFSLGRENKSKHRQLRFALFSLIGSSRFLLLFLLRSIWINVTSFWSLLFSLWLFIYLFQLHPREQRNAEWSLTAMSNISFCQIWPFSLSAVTWCLYVRLRVRHSERGEGALSEWPPQEGSTKSKKREQKQRKDEPEGGRKVQGGRGGHPCRVPGILAGSPHLGFRRLLSKRGKEGLFFTWTWENRCFVSRGGGVSWGEWRDAEKRNKAKDPSSQGMGCWGCGVGSPLGLGRCWNEDDLLALVSLVALGHHPSLRSETESHWK